jgi:hypothetical protein
MWLEVVGNVKIRRGIGVVEAEELGRATRC